MNDRRVEIRPQIDTKDTTLNPAEEFQNKTLRPILKLQHDLLLAIFEDMLEKRKVNIGHLPVEQKEAQIRHRLSKDNKLRYVLLGTVIGQFTTEEYAVYLSMEAEAKKRTFNMIAMRLLDALCS
jgi:hypothetical protein